MNSCDLAALFLSKTSHDKLILNKLLDDYDIADKVLGFHAQQAKNSSPISSRKTKSNEFIL